MSLYIRLDTSFWTHRKTMRLVARLGNDAFWIPPRLWSIAATHQPDGCFKDYLPDEIAMLIAYKGDAQALLGALLEAKFLDSDPLRIHNWHARNRFHMAFSVRAAKAANARWGKRRTGEEKTGQDRTGQEASIAPSNAQASAERPSLEEVQFHATKIGLAPWKAEDWFNEMEGCGWLDYQKRPIASWKNILARVRTKWEADGRPKQPPTSKAYGNKDRKGLHEVGPDRNKGTYNEGTAHLYGEFMERQRAKNKVE